MKKAAVGFRVYSGWAAVVGVSLEKGAPVVLTRQRVQLVKTFSYKFRQPYHTAEKMRLGDAVKFISSVRKEAESLAYRSLRQIKLDLEKQGYQLDCGGLLLASGRTLPELEKNLAFSRPDSHGRRRTFSRSSSPCKRQLRIEAKVHQRPRTAGALRGSIFLQRPGTRSASYAIRKAVWLTLVAR